MTDEIRKTEEEGASAVGGVIVRRLINTLHCATVCTAIALFTHTLLAPSVAAQSRGEAPLVLRLPSSARIAAMANAGIASNDGDALLYNPGMLNGARGMAVSLQRYGSFGTAGAFGTVTQIGVLNVGVGAQFVDWTAPTGTAWGDAVRHGATRLADSGGVAASSSAFTFGVARVIKGVRLGANLKYAEDRFGAQHDGTFAFDLGFTMPLGQANLAIVAQNLGPGLNIGGVNGMLPRRIGIGYGGGMYPLYEHFDLGAQMQLTLEGNSFVRPAGGVEVGYVPIEGVAIVVRSGLRLPREKDESLVTGGLGLTLDRISIDYALEPFRGGRPASHRVGLRIK